MGQGQWQDQDQRINRASRGGQGWRRSAKRHAPLRKVLGYAEKPNGTTGELLECGHVVSLGKDFMGEYNRDRARCLQCLSDREAEGAAP